MNLNEGFDWTQGLVDPGYLVLSNTGIFNNLTGATWNLQGSINPFGGMGTPPAAGQVNNAGHMIVSPNTSVNGILSLDGRLELLMLNGFELQLDQLKPSPCALPTALVARLTWQAESA